MNLISSQQLADLIEKHSAALVLYARQWCSDPDDAVQEALIELTQLDERPRDLAAWLFTTTKRRAINQTRSDSRRRKRDSFSGGAENLTPEQLGNPYSQNWFQSELESREEIEKLQTQLQRLAPLDREIVVAHIWGELSFSQIAELVQRSASSVHRDYQGALEKLRVGWESRPEPPPRPPEPATTTEPKAAAEPKAATGTANLKTSFKTPCSG